MKRVGYVLVAACALLTVFTLALAQLETRNARYLDRVLTGRDLRGYFGSAVAPAARYTGGRSLFAVSASGELGRDGANGKVAFFDSTLAATPVLELTGPVTGELFGAALSGGGDFNGDGWPDLAVGAPGGNAAPLAAAGRVYLYFGGATFGTKAATVLAAGEADDEFGHAVDLTHDITGDGLADLIVSAPRGGYAGRVYIWQGCLDGHLSAHADAEIPYGAALVTGDLTGDGQADLALGRGNSDGAGQVRLYRGGPSVSFRDPSDILLAGENGDAPDCFGASLALLPDVNGDGVAELLVGAPLAQSDGRPRGRVYLYYGGLLLGGSPAAVYAGVSAAGRFGEHVFSIGDVNGDGRGDWAAQAASESAARGVIHFYYGGASRPFHAFMGENTRDRLGNDLVVLNPSFAGRRYILVAARACDADAVNAGRVYALRFE